MNTTTRTAGAGNFVLYGALFVALLVLNGFINFISAEFDLSTFMDPTYWLKTITGSSSGLAAFIIFSFLRRDTMLIKRQDYNDKLQDLNKAVRQNVGPDFPDFIAEKNLISKTVRWKEKIENKLAKWHNRVPSSVLKNIKRISEDEKFIHSHNPFKVLTRRRANKWLRKRNKYEQQRTESWIKENIYYVKVRYPETTPGEIINGERNTSTRRVIDNGAIRHIMADRMPIILITVALQAGYHSLVIVGAENPVGMWMGIIFQLTTILINAGTGLSYGSKLFVKLDMNNITTREQYMMDYLMWRKKRKEQSLERSEATPSI